MSNTSKLGALIQPKGKAARPAEVPQRGGLAPAEAVQPVAEKQKKDKSLTVKLTNEQYKRLRVYSFTKEQSHQTVIETALMRFLDSEGA